MLKVVLDTNLLIDAYADDYNYCNRIIDEVIAGNLLAFANKATANENRLLTERKIQDDGFQKKLKYYFETVRPVETGRRLDLSEDPEDNKILSSAVESNADYLITSDKHLLVIGKVAGIKILTPGEFWFLYDDQRTDGWQKWIKQHLGI
jgi:uncharacterized protein